MSGDRPYIVRQGDYVAKIASQLGCSESEIWSHEKNKELKESGRTKDVLAPGDVLYVPERTTHRLGVALATSNELQGNTAHVKVTVFFREDDCPIGGERYTATVGGKTVEGTSGADGSVTLLVPTSAHSIFLEFPELLVVHHLRVGDVDPIETRSGQLSRLRMLDYLEEATGRGAPSDDDIRGAISAFQDDHKLPVTGQLDDPDLKRLKDEFGC